MNGLRIVFAGTPEFGVPCLRALFESRHEIVAVYSQPDRPAGRGRLVQPSAVKSEALLQDCPVYQPLNFKSEEACRELANLQPDLMIVIAYGLILPQKILSIPTMGCINVHASLLPRWRGASPIQQAILQGDTETGVTIMQMDAGMDTGAMLTSAVCAIEPTDTTGSLHDRLSKLSVTPLLTTLDLLQEGKLTLKPQDNAQVTYAGKISKEDAVVDWQLKAAVINNKIRAFNPWPVACTHYKDAIIRIHKARVEAVQTSARPGTVLQVDKSGMMVATSEDVLCIETLQFPGGKILSVADWMNSGRWQAYIDQQLQ